MSLNAAANIVENHVDDNAIDIHTNYKGTGQTMKALTWLGKEKVEVREAEIPAVTDPDDVVCKVTGTTVCGSDLHLYHKEIMELRSGDILGHEWCGIVEEVGPNVKKLKKGDRVVSSFQIACGHCKFCKAKISSMCDNTNPSKVQEMLYGDKFSGIYGYSHFTGGYAGGQAEYCRAPHAEFNLLKIPDSVPDEKALYLSDIVPTSYHSVECAEVKEGSTVAIWGLGPIGLCAAKWCQLKKAAKIIVIDNQEYRLSKAREFGCTPINFDEKNVLQEILKLVPGGVDCSIDAAAFRYAKSLLHKAERAVGLETDTSEIVNEAIKSTRKFGTISLVADYVGLTNHFLIGALMEKGITLRGCGQAPVQKYWEYLLEKIVNEEFDPTFILSHRFKLDEFAELYEAFDKKKGGIMKTFVETKFSFPPYVGSPKLSSVKDL